MSGKVVIQIEEMAYEAELNLSETATAIAQALPLESAVNVWGEEIYFSIPVKIDEATDARQEMAVGELGYWPAGSAFCIFFGRTPVSTDDTPRAFSNVNPFGWIIGDVEPLRSVPEGAKVRVEHLEK